MPVPKRWFPCNRDINEDPEVRELCNRFGLSGLRLFLEVMAIIDKTENAWRLSGDYIGSLSVKVGCKPATTRQVLQFMEDKNWLRCDLLPGNNQITTGQQPSKNMARRVEEHGNNMVYSAPNYWKYHKRREPKTDKHGSSPILSDPSLSFPNHQEKKETPDPDCASPNNENRGLRRGSPPQGPEGTKQSAKDRILEWAERYLGEPMRIPTGE